MDQRSLSQSLYAIDGRKGTILWSINSNYGEPVAETSNFYTPLLIPKDVDGDSVTDIIGMPKCPSKLLSRN